VDRASGEAVRRAAARAAPGAQRVRRDRRDDLGHARRPRASASILDIYHDNARQPGVARLRSRSSSPTNGRALLARRTLVQEDAGGGAAGAAVAAFDVAIGRLLDELVPWREREAAKARPS
jgi:hypothetical protein